MVRAGVCMACPRAVIGAHGLSLLSSLPLPLPRSFSVFVAAPLRPPHSGLPLLHPRMASRAPWYCRYGIHGDLEKEVNVDGTVVYRTRERPCDCTPPRPCSLALPLAHPRPHPPPLRGRPAVPRAAPQRQRTSSRITGTEREDVVPPWETAHVPLPDSSQSCHSDEMVGTSLHVLVPPLALDSAVGDFYAGYVSSMSHGAAATLPHLPVISPLATVETETPFTVVTAPLEMGRCVDSLPVGMSPAPQLPAQELQPAAAAEQLPGAPPQESGSGNPQSSPTPLLQQDLLPPPASPSAAEVAAPAPLCNAESHAVDQRCGFVYCPACGVRVAAPASSASEAVQYPPTMCPMAPHRAAGEEHGSQAGGAASWAVSASSAALISRPPRARPKRPCRRRCHCHRSNHWTLQGDAWPTPPQRARQVPVKPCLLRPRVRMPLRWHRRQQRHHCHPCKTHPKSRPETLVLIKICASWMR
ncbi:hypothetical protein LtaPh_0409400 [Leishmania tarentolae]|uniref:Uncharacterized protein n=1 Tax=Leishmania tarentolae TaxID=5689 RepID=A0A640K9B4_LEITA|nr:hypothetical protein LtaPh_0409400 [Leishmania tarentolae]